MQIGHSGKSSGTADTNNVNGPADVFVYAKTNELFVADGYGNKRVIVFDADTGAYKRMWGAFGNPPVDDPVPTPAGSNKPVDPKDLNRISAKDVSPTDPGLPQFNLVHGVKVSNDGLVYVSDSGGERVQVFTVDGKFVTQVFI